MTPKHALPDWDAPLDIDSSLARIPSEATVRGLFFQDLERMCTNGGKRPPEMPARLVAFGNHSLRRYAASVIEAAQLLWPEAPLREGVRRIGRAAYPAFADSLIGRVIFGVLGKDFQQIVRVCAKGYEVSLSHGRARALEVQPGRAIVRVDDMVNLFDTLQVGVFEGAMQTCGVDGEVAIWLETPISGELLLTWEVERA